MKILSHDSDRQDLTGKEVELVRVVDTPDDQFDEEVLPMYYVKVIETSEVVLCFPDELDGLVK